MEKRRCQINGCLNKYYAKGFCAKHYQKNRLQQIARPNTSTFIETATAMERGCKVPGCHRKYVAKGLCANHYQKQRQMSVNATSQQEKLTPNQERQPIGRFTGIVREVDPLGRIVLPIELRRILDIEVSDALEIFVDKEIIILRKYSPGCIFCGNVMSDTVYFKGKIVCKECMGSCKSDS